MAAFAVIGSETIKPIHGQSPPASEAKALRTRYGAEDGSTFTALLIGKDGGVKWRDREPADLSRIFSLIDSMPMRRQEMTRQESGS
jgi:hypothetical protein